MDLKSTKKGSLDKLNQEVWLKPYIYVNTGLRENAKNDFEKDFLKLMNWTVFGKAIENMRKHRYQARNSQSKKQLFSVETKIYNKNFFR